jgi:hypothetical protein
MDMSFHPRTGEPLPPPRLDFRTLVAGLATGMALSPRGEAPAVAPCAGASGLAGDLCLAAVILGRPGWRDAARALGGGFSVAAGA